MKRAMRLGERPGWGGAAVLAGFLSGCATMINSPTQSILVTSDPVDASVVIDDRVHVQTPGIVRLSRQSAHTAIIRKEGFQPVKVELLRGASAWALLDFFCLPLIYYCISSDVESGGFFAFNDTLHVTLSSEQAPSSDSRHQTDSSGLSPLDK